APVAVAAAAAGLGGADESDAGINLFGVSPADPAPGVQAVFKQERDQAEYELTQRVETATPQRTAKAQYAAIKRQERRTQATQRGEGAEGAEREGGLALHPVVRGLIAVVILGVAALGVVYMSEAF